MTEKKTATKEKIEPTPQKQGSKGLLVGLFMVAIAIVAGAFILSQNGSAVNASNNETNLGETNLGDIAPASASATSDVAEADAPVSERPVFVEGNPVVATFDGKEVKRSDVLNFIAVLPEQVRQLPIENLFPLALDQVIGNMLVDEKASQADLSNDEEVTELLANSRQQIVRNVYLERQIQARLTEERLQSAYQEAIAEIDDVQETRARHILLETEEKAREVIAMLDNDGEFAALAGEHSVGPTGPNGGDLGYFAEGEMVPAFSDAAFALDVGAYTTEPVQTQFGWHVIMVEDRRAREAPAFEAVRGQLEAQLRQEVMNEIVTEWQADVEIERFDINGEPVPEAADAPAE